MPGSIAEGFYGVSYSEKEMCNRLLPESMLEVLDRFDKVSRKNFLKVPYSEEDLTDELIENAIRQFNKDDSDESRKRLMNQSDLLRNACRWKFANTACCSRQTKSFRRRKTY